jgi:hypothetical protein
MAAFRTGTRSEFTTALRIKNDLSEAVFLVSLGTSLFAARHEVEGEIMINSFPIRNELAPSSFPAWLKVRPLDRSAKQLYVFFSMFKRGREVVVDNQHCPIMLEILARGNSKFNGGHRNFFKRIYPQKELTISKFLNVYICNDLWQQEWFGWIVLLWIT